MVNFNLKSAYWDCLFLLTGKKSSGLKRYTGQYAHGDAWFSYREEETENVYEGRFIYRHDYMEYGHKAYTDIRGKFADGRKEGRWKFRHMDSSIVIKTDIDYSAGNLNGLYHVARYRTFLDGLLTVAKTHDLKLTLVNGVPVGEVVGFSRYQTFKAYCDQAGLPDGTWTLVDSDMDKTIHYTEIWEHGVLKNSFYIDQLTGRKITCEEHVRKAIQNIVQHYSYGLERRIERGSNYWKGRIHSFKGNS